MKSRLEKWQRGKARLAALKKSQENHVAIEVVMRIKLDGIKRPICADCNHSVMSHGERDGKLFCWGCFAIDSRKEKQCQHQN
jgi:hypothetical protein